jgi:hypothetical protein
MRAGIGDFSAPLQSLRRRLPSEMGAPHNLQEHAMKPWIIAALCLFGLAGCSSEYIITTTDGQMLTSDGKPELDRDTGMLEFTDSEGRKQQIPQSSVKQMLER